MKLRVLFAFLFVFLALVFSGSIMAESPKHEHSGFVSSRIQLNNNEKYTLSDIFSEETIISLQSVGFPTDRELLSRKEENETVLNASEDISIRFDKRGVMIGITNWERDGELSGLNRLQNNEETEERENRIRELLCLGENYHLTVSRNWDNDYYEYRFQKIDKNGVLSDYDSAKAYVAKADGTVVSLGFFYTDNHPDTIVISEKEAKEKATEYFENWSGLSNIQNDEVFLAYKEATRGGELQEDSSSIHYCYCVTFGDGAWMVYVDTETGAIVSIDGLQSEKTAAFGPTLNNTSDLHGYDAVEYSYAGMNSIGYVQYNKYHYDTYTLKTKILNYIGIGGNEYAMYIRCHGCPSYICGKNSSNTEVWKIYPSDLSGNWHFVFLDGCETGASNNFASALHIYGYSNRAFLGWYSTVATSASKAFVQNYWPILASSTTKTVRQAALDTAALIASSTPIRFYGDTSYNGRPQS